MDNNKIENQNELPIISNNNALNNITTNVSTIQSQPAAETAPVETVQPVVESTPTVEVTAQPVQVTTPVVETTLPSKSKNSNPIAIIIIIVAIIILVIFGLQKFGVLSKNKNNSVKKGTLLENVELKGYMCMNEECSYYINGSDEASIYYYSGKNKELFGKLNDYEDYIIVNIYYNESSGKKIINSYEILLKENKSNISDVKNENELREKIGLYATGTHTDKLTLKKIGTSGFGVSDNNGYTYINYNFESSNGIVYEMKYIFPEGHSENGAALQEGNTYDVTFEVIEGTFDYEYNIKEIK